MTTGTDCQERTVLMTGGCSFISSHLVDALVARDLERMLTER